MEIFVKPDRIKVDPKHPETHPDFERSRRIGQRNFAKMEFENEAQKRDYIRSYNGNPGNVVGIPPFFPPLQLRSFNEAMGREYTAEEQFRMEQERIRLMTIHSTSLHCPICESVTPHMISPKGSFCQKCGTPNRFRS